mmetsp:Transcript_5090/g.11185  ORF Transcript_5090/g.11185 Transcript_5090/m.11185 type:complete len:210 (+) Transcript_5090:1588-2217(+)
MSSCCLLSLELGLLPGVSEAFPSAKVISPLYVVFCGPFIFVVNISISLMRSERTSLSSISNIFSSSFAILVKVRDRSIFVASSRVLSASARNKEDSESTTLSSLVRFSDTATSPPSAALSEGDDVVFSTSSFFDRMFLMVLAKNGSRGESSSFSFESDSTTSRVFVWVNLPASRWANLLDVGRWNADVTVANSPNMRVSVILGVIFNSA